MTDLANPDGLADSGVVRHDLLASRNYRNSWYQTIILAVTAIIGLVAVFVGANSAVKQQAFQTETFANQTWESYRRLEMEYTEKYGPSFGVDDSNKEKQALYWLLVERLLMAGDGITISLEDDPQWRDSFVYEFSRHRSYLISDEFLKHDAGVMSSYCTFRKGVRTWIRKAFQDDNQARELLIAAERECKAALDREGFVE